VTVILAVIGDNSAALDDAVIRRALTAMRNAPDDRVAIWRSAGALLAVARQPWELSPSMSGDALVVTDGEIAVAADASIYYRDDLRAALARARVVVTGDDTGVKKLGFVYPEGPAQPRLERDLLVAGRERLKDEPEARKAKGRKRDAAADPEEDDGEKSPTEPQAT